MLSPKLEAALKTLFDKMDIDKDGSVTKEEATKFFKSFSKINANAMFNEVDEDGYVPVICGLSRANPKDIERAWEAVKPAVRPRVHTFIATSPIHMETKLKKTPDEVLQIAVDAVKFAKSLGCDDIEFSPEDAGRSDPEFLIKCLVEYIESDIRKEYATSSRTDQAALDRELARVRRKKEKGKVKTGLSKVRGRRKKNRA